MAQRTEHNLSHPVRLDLHPVVRQHSLKPTHAAAFRRLIRCIFC